MGGEETSFSVLVKNHSSEK